MMARLTLVPTSCTADHNTGEALLNDVFDMLSERLPYLPLEDPARPALAALCPMLAQSLGRSRLALIGGDA